MADGETKAWWLYIDFGSDHRMVYDERAPDIEWLGPYETLAETKAVLGRIGANEVEGIRSSVRYWRSLRKSEILAMEGGS